ncbi:hypothetical protein QUW57_07470 [Phocaeicola plebeius]|uniref:hypothetical protein n=1 Tax=Phocaeicola plebeius TaxID=310297 RepID=UPI0021ACF06F|nr:hypothetical protein [Phocaeicola plebeius]MCR8883678.1 hypothetical protein [Phocaeicola plebeius]MDM8286421.1 hypothetical protein [Phocaeicola plebeius]
MKYILTVASAGLFLLSGCQKEKIRQDNAADGSLRISIISSGMNYGITTESETNIHTLDAYHFENGILSESFNSLQIDEKGVCRLDIKQKNGMLYFLANDANITSRANLTNNVTTLEEFLQLTATADEMTSKSLLMSGHTELNGENASLSVSLKRTVARIDLESAFQDAEVNSITIRDIALTGLVNEGGEKSVLTNIEKTDLTKDFGEQPFKNKKESLYYLPEQTADGHAVEILMAVNGGWHRLKTTLPPLKRNTVYTLKVYGNGANLNVEVLTDNWEIGNSSESGLTLKGLVDKENSQLSEGVTVNERGDTVFVPSWNSNFQLTLAAESGAQVSILGEVEGVTVTPASQSRSLSPVAEFNVSSRQKMPGSKSEYMYLDIYNDQIQTGRVVLVFTPNPVQMSGLIEFDQNGECNFNRYVDGELASLILPEGKTATLKFAEEEAHWMKLAPEGGNTYRLLGGWKPNDPKADGREQAGELIITNEDGSHPETYTIRRLNWGLPVVNINGTWWCKYNLRGNVKNFNDQILINSDPAKDSSLADYLTSCSDNEFLHILGDQYQAGNPDGLQLTHNDSSFYYEGYKSQTDNFGTLSPTVMAPDGYQIPDFDDYRFFTGSTNFNLGYFNPGAFNNGLGQRLNFKVVERNATFQGLQYGPITFYDFEYEGSHWTICGLGHQWDATSISKMMILLATYGNGGSTWMIEGYSNSEGRGNWFKYTGNNAQKTRTIRCVKTPVEYIYE